MTRLIVDPLTRVEGHGRVELLLEDGRLADVMVRLLEAPRLFESLVVGRRYDEVPELVCRICAICSAAHKLTSLQALDMSTDLFHVFGKSHEFIVKGSASFCYLYRVLILALLSPDRTDRSQGCVKIPGTHKHDFSSPCKLM